MDTRERIDNEIVQAVLSKIEDLENSQFSVPNRLLPLTTSNTLEDVKGRLNQIIAILNSSHVEY